MAIFLVAVVDKQIIIGCGALVLADDKLRLGQGDQRLYRGIVAIVEVDQDVELQLGEVEQLGHHGLAVPVEMLVGEEVARQLGQTIEGHLLVVHIADQAHILVLHLQLGEDGIDAFIGILVGDFAQNAHRTSMFQGRNLPLTVHPILPDIFTKKISFYLCEHKKLNFGNWLQTYIKFATSG